MTDRVSHVDGGLYDEVLVVLERQFHGLLQLTETLADRAQEDEPISAAQTQKELRELQRVLTLLIEERNRIEKRRIREEGIDPTQPIDFDAVRDALGCRLDRIRERS